MDEPVAIIGLDARFPGDGDTAESFYQSLLAGRSARSRVPSDRYNAEAFWHPDAERRGATHARHGHFLKGSISAFDAPFFSITPTEAKSMDPQQRGMLESVYKALENAGIPLARAAGSQTGVYVGCFTSDYNDITVKDLDVPSKYAATGTVASMLSNRVSWFYDFCGPSITVDTACSSSLVAAHEACMSLRLREISMAIVGGCNLILTPEMTLKLGAAGVLGPDGKSYSFDSRGNGYARGEGFGVLVLKRVSDAIRDGDVIRAVIRNSSTNQDGRSPGITQPTKAAQARLIKHVYSRAGLDPSLTRYFEAHGTGTSVGDPIEASAISEIFAPHRSPDQPLYVGALKSNVGHLEGAAGVAAIIKGVLTLERGVIPPNVWLEKVNPKIDEAWNLAFPTKPITWPQSGLRRMSINSFGIGGSNAHVVMDDALHFLEAYGLFGNHCTDEDPRAAFSRMFSANGLSNGFHHPEGHAGSPTQNGPSHSGMNGSTHATNGFVGNGESKHVANGASNTLKNGTSNQLQNGSVKSQDRDTSASQLLVLSSYDQDGLFRLRDAYKKWIGLKLDHDTKPGIGNEFLSDLSYTLAAKRTHHPWRSIAVVNSLSSLETALEQMPKPTRTASEPRLGFVFTGQGAQWPAMGLELMVHPTFRQSVLSADAYLSDLGCPWSLTYELCKTGAGSRLDNPEFCQPICTALQVALVDLLAEWNIRPRAVTGHSSGEVAAAYAAGAISKEAAWKVSYYRGKFSAQLCNSNTQSKTGMAAVGLDFEKTQAAIDRVNEKGGEGTLEIACFNSWQSHTVSGDARKVDALVKLLNDEKVFARRLNVEIAYHSQYMRAIAAEYLEAMGELEEGSLSSLDSSDPLAPQFFSSTYGIPIPPSRLREPSYWVQNLVSPVRFCESATAMLKGSTVAPKVNGYRKFKTDSGPATTITDILEIGPHSALKGPLSNISKQIDSKNMTEYHSVLRRHHSATESAIEAAGSLFCRGYNVNLPRITEATHTSDRKPRMLTDLPSYQFNHAVEYWKESRTSREFRLRKHGRHELLGVPIPGWNKHNATWRNYIRLSENPWIEDHKVSGNILYPAAGMLVMALEAGRQIADEGKALRGFRFKDVSFHLALPVDDDDEGVESYFYLRPHREASAPAASSWHEFQLWTVNGDDWREHCRGLVNLEYQPEGASAEEDLEEEVRRSLCSEEIKLAQSYCSRGASKDNVYRNFQDSGLQFGPSFQTLRDVRLGEDLRLLARVDSPVPLIQEMMPHHYVQPHLLHPATLDGIIHANLAPLALESSQPHQARVPVFAEEVWIAAGPQVSHDSYTVSVQAELQGSNDAQASAVAIHPESGQPLVCVSGISFRALPGASPQSSQSANPSSQSAFKIEWKPDPTFASEEQSKQAFGISMNPDEDPSAWMEDCEALCMLYIRSYLDSWSKDSTGKLDWHHREYVAWMEHAANSLAEKKINGTVQEYEEKVKARGTAEGRLIIAVGQALREMLGGHRDPLDVIFGDKIAEDVYRDGLGSKRCYAQLCNYIDALAHKNPSLRVLEIGAGTGGATRPVMKTLTQSGRRYEHYEFTDISPSFFEHARENFKDELDNMGFRVLNVENDPVDQGFGAGTYDVVVAANVLHATKNIDVSLSHAKKLLKPGGTLLLFEITNLKILLSTFCFGVLPGWWLSEDRDRVWGPLMSVDSWRQHLTSCGFSGLAGVFDDFPGSPHQMSSILASKTPVLEPVSQKAAPICLITDDVSPLQKGIAKSLSINLAQHFECRTATLTSIKDQDTSDAICIFIAELETSVLQHLTEQTFEAVRHIILRSKSVVWLTRGGNGNIASPDLELVTGLARVARLERPDLRFLTLSFADGENQSAVVEKTMQIVKRIDTNTDNTLRIVNGLVHVPRIVTEDNLSHHIQNQTGALDVVETLVTKDSSQSLALRIGTTGQVDALRYETDAESQAPLLDHEVEFKVMASTVQPRDLALLRGNSGEKAFGIEAAGIVTRTGAASKFKVGDRVFGICPSGSVKTITKSADEFLASMEGSISWTEAASIPLAYTTAYAVLYKLGTVGRNDTVLIHSAASGLGQAALQLAQLKGPEVFVTVANNEERDLLRAKYCIPHDHIFSNQSRSFKLGIKRMTGGRGADVVLGSSADNALRDSWDCIAPFGRLVELVSGGAASSTKNSPGKAIHNVRFEFFDIESRILHDARRTQSWFQEVVDIIFQGLQRMSRRTAITSHPFSQAGEAFRQLEGGKIVGHLVLERQDEEKLPILQTRERPCTFDSQATYVIAGGLGGLGRSVARWMASRGARNLILFSRRGPVEEAAHELIRELKTTCEHVVAPACDLKNQEALRKTLGECLSFMPPIKGCIQGSMVLKDNQLKNMTLEEWNDATQSKLQTSKNLIEVIGQDLDFLVLLSSTIGVTGNLGQANYAAGGTYQDALARFISSQGVHAVSIDLPVVRGVGFVAEKPELMDYMRSTGWAFMDENELHATLDYYCRPQVYKEAGFSAQVIPRFWLPQETAVEGYEMPNWRHEPIFSHLSHTKKATPEEAVDTTKRVNHSALLAQASSLEQAGKIILDALLLKISRVLSVDVSNLDANRPLHAYGVDSLVAVELRSWLAKEIGAEVSVFDITSKGSIYQLVATVTEKSKLTLKLRTRD